ncbi:MAG: hypothetical protein WBM32_10720 [Crocosphaera sp.]|jgi:ribosomal protein L37AE/L43A
MKKSQRKKGAYYDGVFYSTEPKYTSEQQWDIVEHHPFFTGVCPECQHKFENIKTETWDCPECGYEYQTPKIEES